MTPLYRATLFLLASSSLAGVSFGQLRLSSNCRVEFANVEQGIAAITADDAFTRSLSRFDLQARMKTDREVSLKDWKQFVAGEVREWNDEAKGTITKAIETVRDRLAKFKIPLPDEVWLVATTGMEEGNAAYCRGRYIVIPEVVLKRDETEIASLLIHELFHVISNQHPELRADLYAIVGFQECPDFVIHPSLKDRRITNPDAPTINCVIKLQEGEKVVRAAPILYSETDFDPKKENFFSYLKFRLMVVAPEERGWKAIDQGGRAFVLDPKNVPDFHEKIGRNTTYIIHPEEILADNFVHLVKQRDKIATPRIVEELRKVLERK